MTEPDAPRRVAPRWLVWLVVGLAALFVIVLFFIIGALLPAGRSGPATGPATTEPATPGPTASVSAAPTVTPAGPAAPGEHEWSQLRGGECLSPFVSAWEPRFTVVDCATPHAAQLVAGASLSADPAAPYPGEAAITQQLNLACTAPAVLDSAAAAAYADLQWQASYPASAEQWAAGVREYACFFSRAGGGPLAGTLQPPG